ncbi:uncharacterized protein LOC119652416 isoform X2 [Hermetia illucens]|uniref:uncharacterized protein LOC119652416 isoform X2 n=1 Tax=Hermetia illucens TaxID=343691 RepID=UPI0018CC095E|nr:uncharacterized protein LOC119652416 isoform X2 [Hermetia illucens]
MVQGQRNLLLLVLFSVIVFVIAATTTTTTTIQPLNPEKARSKFSTSGAVNKDGSFEFILENEDSGIFIEIEATKTTTQPYDSEAFV